MDKMDREILAVKTVDVQDLLSQAVENDGFKDISSDDEYKQVLKYGLLRKRLELEADENYKQIIPYLMVIDHDKIFYYVRASGIGEERLKNKVSIGLGGHIEVEDIDEADEAIENALKREVNEEIGNNVVIEDIKPLGFIYTEGREVDRVHLGILFVGNIIDKSFDISSDEIGENGFLDKEGFKKLIKNGKYSVEGWTEIAWRMAQNMI